MSFYANGRCALAAGVATAALLSATQVSAQAIAPAKAPAAETAGELETVVVTANRREELAQTVPIAVSSVSNAQAQRLVITDPNTLARITPGLQVNRVGGWSAAFIRGVGTTLAGPTIEPSIATYVDDVYIPMSSSALADFNSIQQVSVLKGPQGTLFGRNATGGVIQIHTKDPTPEPHIDVSVGYASYNEVSGNLYATGELAPNLSANIALYGRKRNDGWGHNITNGDDVYLAHEYGGRAKFLWTPGNETTVLVSLDSSYTYGQDADVYNIRPGTLNSRGFPGAGFYDANLNFDPYYTNKQTGGSVKVTQDIDWASLKSVTAYRRTKGTFLVDNDYGPSDAVNSFSWFPENVFTQEFQVLSPADAKISWLVGAFYYRDKGGSEPLRFYGSAFGPTIQYQDDILIQTSTSYAAYGQGTATIFTDTHLTAGLRYTEDRRRLDASYVNKFVGAPLGPTLLPPNATQHANFNSWTWRVSLDHQFTPDIMGYVAYNRGFKSGLFNVLGTVSATAAPAPAVRPEVLDAFTAGEKAEFLDRRVRVNAEAFYYDYRNIQLQQILGAGTLLTNAAAAHMKGIDVDVAAAVTSQLTLTAAVEAMRGKYTSFPNGLFNVYNPAGGNCSFTVVPGGPAPCGGRALPPNYNPVTGTWDLKGNDTIATPRLTFTFTGNYVIPSSVGEFDLNASWSHSSSYFSDADNALGQVSPSYPDAGKQKALDLFNASIGWTAPDGRWDVRVWGKNLSDKQYWIFSNEGTTGNKSQADAPRTVGVTVGVHI